MELSGPHQRSRQPRQGERSHAWQHLSSAAAGCSTHLLLFVSLGDGVSTADSVRHGNGESCQCSLHTECATASAVVTTMCNCHCSRHTASVLTTPPNPCRERREGFQSKQGFGGGVQAPKQTFGGTPPTHPEAAGTHVRHVCSVQANLRQQGLPLLGALQGPSEGSTHVHTKDS